MESEIVFGPFVSLPINVGLFVVVSANGSLDVYEVLDPKVPKDSFDLGVSAHLHAFGLGIKLAQVLSTFGLDAFICIPNLSLLSVDVCLPTDAKNISEMNVLPSQHLLKWTRHC